MNRPLRALGALLAQFGKEIALATDGVARPQYSSTIARGGC